MNNGLYSGAAALDVLAKQQELISANLMHVNTSGHRRQQLGVNQRFEVENTDTTIDLGPEAEVVRTDFSVGRQVDSGRPLDVALSGDGFLVFDDGNGEYLSRNGRLFRDAETNQLVNEDGFPIQGETGPVTIPADLSERDISIAADGTVSSAGQTFGQIKTVTFLDNQTLIPLGASGFVKGENSVEADETVQIAQHRHELSNVHPVSELVSLIVNTRQYEAVQRATRAISDSLSEYIRQ